MKLTLIVLKDLYAIYKLDPNSDIPISNNDSEFYSLTKTSEELSIVCNQSYPLLKARESNKDWRILKIQGPFSLSSVGIIAEVSRVLRQINIPIFTISTYDTDYILVKDNNLDSAINSLKHSGHTITN